MNRSLVVIERPDLQTGGQRLLHSVLTFLAWGAWAYLWLPLITALAWYAGLRSLVREMIRPDPATMTLIFALYAVVVFSMGAVLVLWARYNRRRFGTRNRRERLPDEEDGPSPLESGLTAPQLALLRGGGSLVVVHDAKGGLLRVRAAQPPARRQPPERAPVRRRERTGGRVPAR